MIPQPTMIPQPAPAGPLRPASQVRPGSRRGDRSDSGRGDLSVSRHGERADIRPQTEATLLAMEARLIALLRAEGEPSAQHFDRIMRITGGKRPAVRVNILLLIGSGLCAASSGRLAGSQFGGLLEAGLMNRLIDSPEGRLIERHSGLLARLVYRGCRRRGEIPAFTYAESAAHTTAPGGRHAHA